MNRVVFVSYARHDRLAVEPAVDLLRAGGVEVFVDVLSIGFGERWKDVLNDALARCERVLVFWSRAAAASEWVEREWRSALALGKKIVPTLLDRTPLPVELAEFQAVTRLLRDGAPPAAEPSLGRPPPQPSAAPPGAAARRGARTPLVLAGAGVVAAAALVAGAFWLSLGSEPPSVTLPPPGPPASGPTDGAFEPMLVESRPLWLALAVIVMLLLIAAGRLRTRNRKRLDDTRGPVRRSGASQTDSTITLGSDGPPRPFPSWAASFIDDVFAA
jgi:TIR domain